MPPAARISDNHVCPKVEPGPVPHVGGPIIVGSPDTIICFMPAGRVGDMLVCVGPPDTISAGSSNVHINNKQAARLGDSTDHGGKIVVGAPTVIIGTSSQSFALTGASASGAPFCEECEKARKAEEAAKKKTPPNSDTASAPAAAPKSPSFSDDPAVNEKLNEMYRKAAVAKQELDASAQEIADQFGGDVAKAPLKGRARVLEKALDAAKARGANVAAPEDLAAIKDIARNTIIVKAGDEEKVMKALLEKHPDIKKAKLVTAEQDPCGYSGVNVTMPTKTGMNAETQINSPHMIYAKEKPEDARRVLGEKRYNELAGKKGMPPGGEGHKLYEEYRVLSPKSPEAGAKAAESKKYYAAVRAATGG